MNLLIFLMELYTAIRINRIGQIYIVIAIRNILQINHFPITVSFLYKMLKEFDQYIIKTITFKLTM